MDAIPADRVGMAAGNAYPHRSLPGRGPRSDFAGAVLGATVTARARRLSPAFAIVGMAAVVVVVRLSDWPLRRVAAERSGLRARRSWRSGRSCRNWPRCSGARAANFPARWRGPRPCSSTDPGSRKRHVARPTDSSNRSTPCRNGMAAPVRDEASRPRPHRAREPCPIPFVSASGAIEPRVLDRDRGRDRSGTATVRSTVGAS